MEQQKLRVANREKKIVEMDGGQRNSEAVEGADKGEGIS